MNLTHVDRIMSETEASNEVVIEEIEEEPIERSIEKAMSFKEEGNKLRCPYRTHP